MFYQKELDQVLRFGDVLEGYVSSTPKVDGPITTHKGVEYRVDITHPAFSVVITPCCSIGKKMISLTPLIHLQNTFFANPYFSEDMTRINLMIDPDKAFPPETWEELDKDFKAKQLSEGKKYTFLEYFVYEKHDLLPIYTVDSKKLGKIETNYYMIDFRNIYKLNCDAINGPLQAPLETKCLQLSVKTRDELRAKIAYYFGNPPAEDQILED